MLLNSTDQPFFVSSDYLFNQFIDFYLYLPPHYNYEELGFNHLFGICSNTLILVCDIFEDLNSNSGNSVNPGHLIYAIFLAFYFIFPIFINDFFLSYCFSVEYFLSFFIFCSFLTILNDIKNSAFQFYRWSVTFLLVWFLCFFKVLQCFLGFSYQTQISYDYSNFFSLYTVFCKFFIVCLLLLIFYASKIRFTHLSSIVHLIEFPIILSFSLLFMLFLSSSYDFFGIYLVMEGLSFTLYTFSGAFHQSVVSLEATLKYFLLGVISTGIYLFGISLMFLLVGTLDFLEVQLFIGNSLSFSFHLELRLAVFCIIFGFLFKLAIFPVHFWIVDVYDGVWTPITALFTVVVKVSILLLFIRILYNVIYPILFVFQSLFIFVSIGSIFLGAFGALQQRRVKRFIAYTSINQIGFIFLGVCACNIVGLFASLLYILLYSISSVIFFFVLLNTEHLITRRGLLYITDFQIFTVRNEYAGLSLIFSFLSMAGLPPFGGFFGKFFIYLSLLSANLEITLLVALFSTLVSAFYYISFIKYCWFESVKRRHLYQFRYVDTIGFIFCLSFVFLLLSFIFFLPCAVHFFGNLALNVMFPFLVHLLN